MAKITKGILFNGIDVYVADCFDIFYEAQKTHYLNQENTIKLGSCLMYAGYLCSSFKQKENKLTLTCNYEKKKIVVCGNGNNYVKGYIEDIENSKFKEKEGYITVITDLCLKEPYLGGAYFNEGLNSAFVNYCQYSEQNPMQVKIEVDFENSKAYAIFMKLLPNAPQELNTKMSEILSNTNFGNFDKILSNNTLEQSELINKCLCKANSIDKVLYTIGREECEKIIDENGIIEVGCDFCNKKYAYFRQDLNILFGDKK